MTAVPAVEIRALRQVFAADGAGLEVQELIVPAGETLALCGPSGSGKTTLLRLVAGILVPDAGELRLDGRPLSSLPDAARRARRRREIGFVFQGHELLPHLDALDNVLLPYRIFPELGPIGPARQRARDLIAALGLQAIASRRPERLSQGERQRLAAARALVNEPRLLLCDEPTSNLDPGSAGRTLDLLLGHAAEKGATLLLVTHDAAEACRCGRRIDMASLSRPRA